MPTMAVCRCNPSRLCKLGLLAFFACSITVSATDPGNPSPTPVFAINTDNGHFFVSRSAEEMNLKGLHAWVDQYANTQLTHMFICPSARRASFRSKTREAIWDPVDGEEPQHRWPQNAKRLYEAGIDPYQVWIDRCREQKLSPWLTMRMNDLHQAEDRSNFQHSSFWLDNLHFWREPDHPHGSALNYAHPEVRQYQLAFVKELLERYDPDGLELDWMRNPQHLSPGKAFEERGHLTEFVRDVRTLLDQWSHTRGHRILLSVRAPAHPDACAGVGIDAIAWANQGLIDVIVATPFYFSTDFDIPFTLWRKRLANAPQAILLLGGVESTARPWIEGTPVGNSLENLYGFTAVGHHQGFDGIYLFNWMDANDWPVSDRNYRTLLKSGLGANVVAKSSRHHPVCFHDTVPLDFPSGTQLPVDASAATTFQIQVGPKPNAGTVSVIVGLAERAGLKEARFRAHLNGEPLSQAIDFPNLREIGGDSVRGLSFSCPRHLVTSDYNAFTIQQEDKTLPQKIVWVELRVEMVK